ncbi:MAG: (2Fe-2S) ferredoxin [Chlamydiales bacterium]|jgi:(2Fe-2S) ferredoxin
MAQFQRHIFVCINQRPGESPKGCCASKGGADVASELKRKLYDRGLKRIVRANKAYCLDQCARGVTLVVYPEGVWYGGVTTGDVDELIESHILGGHPVERLRIPEAELTGRDCSAGGPIEPLKP